MAREGWEGPDVGGVSRLRDGTPGQPDPAAAPSVAEALEATDGVAAGARPDCNHNSFKTHFPSPKTPAAPRLVVRSIRADTEWLSRGIPACCSYPNRSSIHNPPHPPDL